MLPLHRDQAGIEVAASGRATGESAADEVFALLPVPGDSERTPVHFWDGVERLLAAEPSIQSGNLLL